MKTLCFITILMLAIGASAQVAVPITNASSTGTTTNKLVKLTGAPSTAVITATTDTSGIVGICASGCGVNASAPTGIIVNYGVQPCIFDAGNVVAGHYVVNSTATAGDCMDGGATRPLSGQVVGFALATGSGTQNILLNTAEVVPTGPSVTVTTSTPVTVSASDQSGYYYNQHATAATAIVYNLPATAVSKQFCFTNSYNGSASNTGTLTITPAASSYIIKDGVLSTVSKGWISAGAAGDSACVVGTDSTHWTLYVQKGTFTAVP